MKKRQGFTLVELLAVLTILAIIALITVPLVLNVIDSSKEQAEKQSVIGYAKAIKIGIANWKVENPGKKYSDYDFSNVDYEGNDINCESKEIDETGELTLKLCYVVSNKEEKERTYYNYINGEVVKVVNDTNNMSEVNNDTNQEDNIDDNNNENLGNDNQIQDVEQNNKTTICKTKGDKSLELGTEYECEVKSGTNYSFYVLSANSDNTVNLIMDRNICEDGYPATEENTCLYQWYSEKNHKYGPVVSMNKLYNATKDWNNVLDMIMNYTDEKALDNSNKGYQGIKTDENTKITTITGKEGTLNTIGNSNNPLKARMITYTEAKDAGCEYGAKFGTCPAWLVQNLEKFSIFYYLSNNHIQGIHSYWTLSSYDDYTWQNASLMSSRGVLAIFSSVDSKRGIRPVITMPIDELS